MPVARRRRRRPRLAIALLLLVAGSFTAWLVVPSRGSERPAAARTARTAAAPSPARRVLPAAAPVRPHAPRARPHPVSLSRHRFRPPIGARAAILVDAASGRALWQRWPHRRLPIASTTKIMTALLALERLGPRDRVTITTAVARVFPNREGLRPGERVETWKLLYGLMLFSGNDDALALALATAGSRPAFVELMNERARSLGLRHTHFSTPSGVVDRDNYSTAWDLARLTRVALRNPRFRRLVSTRRKRVAWAPPTYAKVYVNKNTLLASYRGADGVKTGWTTRAGQCLVGSATRNGVRLIVVVLGSRNAAREARRLLDLGFRLSAQRSRRR